MSKVLTTCPFCGCGCGVFLEVEDGSILAAAPQRSHPMSRGTLCAKGWNGHQFIHNSERLTKPLIKRNGTFKEVSWNEAISAAAEGFTKARKQHGPGALGVVGSIKCSNEDGYVLMKFARDVLGTDNIDTSFRFYHAPTLQAMTSQLGFAASTASITDIENADLILVVGSNTKDENAKAGSYLVWAARNGVKVIVADCHETELSHFADIYLQTKPGSDVIWLNALANWLIRENKQSAGAKGVNSLAKSLEKYTLEYAEGNSGVSAESLRKVGDLLAGAEKAIFIYSTGLTQQASGASAVRALLNLSILSSDGGKNRGVLPLTLANNAQGAVDVGLTPEFLPGFVPCKGKGLTLGEMLSAAEKGKVKCMYVVGENLAWSAPNASRMDKMLGSLDFLVVQELFLTETAQLADVVLPACSYAEKDGTITSTERRIQLWRRAIPPIGETKPDWEITSLIAQKMGAKLKYTSAESIFEEITRENKWYAGITYKKLSRVGGVQWPLAGNTSGGSAFLPPLKHELLPAKFVAASEMADEEYPYTVVTGRSYFHRITGTLTRRSFTLDKEFADGIVQVNTDDARELGLRSGWRAKITTRRGSIVRTVQVTRGVPARTIYVPIFHKNGLTNALTNDALESESKIPEMKACAAKMEVA